MGRKSKTKTDNKNLIIRDPDALDSDVFGASASFWERHLAIKSETRKWSLLQQTLFIIVLGQLKDWTKGCNDNTVVLNNKKVMQELGWDFNEENFRKIGQLLREEFTYMVTHSGITLQDIKTKKWVTSNLITDAEGDARITKVSINPKFMNHFEDLFYLGTNFGQSFHQALRPDMVSFKSKYSYLLFGDLRTKFEISNHPIELLIKYDAIELRNLFELSPSDYMRNRDKENEKYSGFDYPSFEKNVLNKAIDEINCTEQLKILPFDDGKFFHKIKVKRVVASYVFKVLANDLETIKKERIQLLEAAKRAGLSIEFYPSYKENYLIDPEWKSQWHVDKKANFDNKTSMKATQLEKRRDKIHENSQNMFEIIPNLNSSNEDHEVRSITKDQLQDMEKARVQRIEELQKEIDRLQSEKIII